MEQKNLKYTYMLKCKDGSLYTGWTTDLDKRVACHNAGKGAKYTRARRPVELVYFEQFQTREEAMRRECEIKKLTRKQKEELIKTKRKTSGILTNMRRCGCFSFFHLQDLAIPSTLKTTPVM